MPKKRTYLDYAATTPVDQVVLKAMHPYFSEKFGNAMSLHSFGQEAKNALDNARKQVAIFLHCDANEIIFTSGATESNNFALKGVLRHYHARSGKKSKPHIITTAFEHHCLFNTCKMAERERLAEVTYLPVYKNGIVKVKDVLKAIKKNTILVSIMYVNNEIGTIQPIAEIGKLIKGYNLKTKNQKIIFHTDATQAVNYLDCDVNKLNVALLSLSGHKIYGPKGAGVLYVKKGTPIMQIMDGGEQEKGLRAGTHNLPGIVGLAQALVQVKNQKSKVKSMASLRDYLIKRILNEIPNSWLNGDRINRSPNNANFGFKNVEGESLVLRLDSYGVATSTGSACSSGTLEPSHVLLALGLKPEEAHGSLRITLGKYTTKKEMDYTILKLKESVKKLRNISGDILNNFKV